MNLTSELTDRGWACVEFSDLRPLLLNEAQSLAYRPAGVGRNSNYRKLETVRSDGIAWIDQQTAPLAFAFADRLRVSLNELFFLNLRDVETHFAKYESGAGYDWHWDCLQGPSEFQRVVSFVLYLHSEWQDHFGGELEFRNGEIVKPMPGRCVLFLSDKIEHRVRQCAFTRWSLTGWFRQYRGRQ